MKNKYHDLKPKTILNHLDNRLHIITNIIMVILLYFIISQIFYLASRIIDSKGDLWLTADWVINYSDGFIRRGLLGEILQLIVNATNVNIIELTTYTQIFFSLLVVFFAIYLYSKTHRTFIEKILLCSPAFYIAFSYWTLRAAFRKEVILIAIFAFIIILISQVTKKRISAKTYLSIVLSLFLLFAFIHEMIIFYSPFFAFLFFILYKQTIISKSYLIVSLIILTVSTLLLTITFYIFHGDVTSQNIVCQSINTTTSIDFCYGAISALSQNLSSTLLDVKYQISYNSYLIYYPLFCVLAAIPFFMISYDKTLKISFFLIISILFVFPLFIIGYDWGRWLTIYTSLFTLLTFYLLRTKMAFIRSFYSTYSVFFFIFFIIYTFSWIVPHCCAYPKQGSLFMMGFVFFDFDPF